jgi:hypothetical protein
MGASHQPEKCICAADVSSGGHLAVFGSADARICGVEKARVILGAQRMRISKS